MQFQKHLYWLSRVRWKLLLLFAAASFCSLLIHTGTQQPTVIAATPTVVVNANQGISESGQDDLAVLKSYANASSDPESSGGLGDPTWPLLKDLNYQSVRLIHNEGGSTVDSSGNFKPGSALEGGLYWAQKLGLTAHIVVGQVRPPHLPDQAWNWSPQDWDRYQDYAYKLCRYVVLEYKGWDTNRVGLDRAMFEVTNELEINQNPEELWPLADKSIPQGDMRRYDAMFKLYRVWQAAVDRVAKENPGKTVLIAGPGTGGASIFLSPEFWHDRFIADVAREGLRLDVVSFHHYEHLNGFPKIPNSSIREMIQRIEGKLRAVGRSNARVMMTEWGPATVPGPVTGRINGSHEGGAWTARFFQEMIAGGVDSGSILLPRDNFGANSTGDINVASLLHRRNGQDYPKAVYNVAKMFTMLPGQRKQVSTSSSQPNIGAFASASNQAVAVLVYNQNYLFDWPNQDYRDLTTTENVSIQLNNLPFSGSATVKRYLVDENTSNILKRIESGQPLDVSQAGLQQVEEYSISIPSGAQTFQLDTRTLGKSAVSLWMITVNTASAQPTSSPSPSPSPSPTAATQPTPSPSPSPSPSPTAATQPTPSPSPSPSPSPASSIPLPPPGTSLVVPGLQSVPPPLPTASEAQSGSNPTEVTPASQPEPQPSPATSQRRQRRLQRRTQN